MNKRTTQAMSSQTFPQRTFFRTPYYPDQGLINLYPALSAICQEGRQRADKVGWVTICWSSVLQCAPTEHLLRPTEGHRPETQAKRQHYQVNSIDGPFQGTKFHFSTTILKSQKDAVPSYHKLMHRFSPSRSLTSFTEYRLRRIPASGQHEVEAHGSQPCAFSQPYSRRLFPERNLGEDNGVLYIPRAQTGTSRLLGVRDRPPPLLSSCLSNQR